MTEHEWLSCSDIGLLVGYTRTTRPPTERQVRLFDCACCRRVWHLLADERSRRAVEVAERFADGEVTGSALRAAADAAFTAMREQRGSKDDAGERACGERAAEAALLCCSDYSAAVAGVRPMASPEAAWAVAFEGWYAAVLDLGSPAPGESAPVIPDLDQFRDAEAAIQCLLFRDIVGNPFRPVVADPSWRTSTVVALARGMYAERAFDLMPLLADALMDAGCADEEVLDHCREPDHVRGCWLLDILLQET